MSYGSHNAKSILSLNRTLMNRIRVRKIALVSAVILAISSGLDLYFYNWSYTLRTVSIPFHIVGNAYSNTKNWQKCERYYTTAIKIDPIAPYFISRGTAYLKSGQCILAENDFDAALKLSPSLPEVLKLRHDAYVCHNNINAQLKAARLAEPKSYSNFIAETIHATPIFSDSAYTKQLLQLPAGQMIKVLLQTDLLVTVQLYNSGTTGYVQAENITPLSYNMMDIILPKKSHSVIDPETDTVDLLFSDAKFPSKQEIDLSDINLKEQSRNFGIKGEVGNPNSHDKGLLLPNGIYARISRQFEESSIFFLDLKKRAMVGIINPTLPNWDIELCNDKLYVATSATLKIIDYRAIKILSTINLPATTLGVACWKDRKLYASLLNRDEVVVIDVKTGSLIKTLKVGPAPWALWRCQGNKICVENLGVVEFD